MSQRKPFPASPRSTARRPTRIQSAAQRRNASRCQRRLTSGSRHKSSTAYRSATAQARLTGGMVVAMPLLMGAIIELVSPGFTGSMLADPAAVLLLALAAALQVAGFLAIRRLGGVRP